MNQKYSAKSRVCLNIGKFEDSKYKISINQLFLALILFDEVILRGGFQDIFQLIEVLGSERANELISSGCLKFEWDIQGIASVKSTNVKNTSIIRPLLISSADSGRSLEKRIQQLEMFKHRVCIPKSIFLPLQKNILENLNHKVPTLYEDSFANTKLVFASNIDFVKDSLINEINEKYQTTLNSNELRLEINQYTDTQNQEIFEVNNNLAELTKLDGDQIYEAIMSCYYRIERPLVAIEYSQKLDTFLGHNEFERANFQVGVEELLSIKNAKPSLDKLDRVLEIGKVPNFERYISEIKIDKLIEIRNSVEIVNFRLWLKESKKLSDEELEILLNSIWQKILSAYQHGIGKALRVVLSTAVTPLVGIGISIFDTFISDKLLKPSSPISFIEDDLNSIFPIHVTGD